MGLTAKQWISVTPTQYNAIPKGNDYFPDGMFLENDPTTEIDQYSGGQLHWVSSLEYLAAGLTPASRKDRCRPVQRDSPRIRFLAPPVTQTSTGGTSTS